MAQRHRNSGKKPQSKHGYVERFFRVTPTRNAAFISKLFSMVDDENTHELITWTGNGDQFTVFNNTEFSSCVLPRYFKHCNWSSFVRQLNMYDFHKINDTETEENPLGSSETTVQRWDFKHPWFYKNGSDRLHKIRRKPPRNRLIPQIRYSSAMEIIPPNSPDYETEPDNIPSNSNAMMESSLSPPMDNNFNPIPTFEPAVHQTIKQLQNSTSNLESKLEYMASEVQYLRQVVETQQTVMNELLSSFEYIKSKYNIQENALEQTARKPRKIHELLGNSNEPQNIEYSQSRVEGDSGSNNSSELNKNSAIPMRSNPSEDVHNWKVKQKRYHIAK